MKIAYLINQYPMVSHSFIRREILALERRGIEVFRFSMRKTSTFVDDADRSESAKTIVLLGSKIELARALIRIAFARPRAFLKATFEGMKLWRKSDRGLMAHIAYIAEACALANHLSNNEIQHVHAHFGTNSATVAMLASRLSGKSFSFTAHGRKNLTEFKRFLYRKRSGPLHL